MRAIDRWHGAAGCAFVRSKEDDRFELKRCACLSVAVNETCVCVCVCVCACACVWLLREVLSLMYA